MPLGNRLHDEGVCRAVFGGLYVLQLDQILAQCLGKTVHEELPLVRALSAFEPASADFVLQLIKALLNHLSFTVRLQRLETIGLGIGSDRMTSFKFNYCLQFAVVERPYGLTILGAAIFNQVRANTLP